MPEIDKQFDFSAERVVRSVDESLERLGLEFIDIIQVKIGRNQTNCQGVVPCDLYAVYLIETIFC